MYGYRDSKVSRGRRLQNTKANKGTLRMVTMCGMTGISGLLWHIDMCQRIQGLSAALFHLRKIGRLGERVNAATEQPREDGALRGLTRKIGPPWHIDRAFLGDL